MESAIGTHIVKVTYGLETTQKDDKYIKAFEDSVTTLDLLVSGSSILEFLPLLARFPTWTPVIGPSLQRLADSRAAQEKIRTLPWVDAKEAYVSYETPYGVNIMLTCMMHVVC